VETPIPAWASDEQRRIADFLDAETSQIDTLIAEQERFIGLLNERRDAAWSARLDEAAQLGPTLPIRRVIESIVDGPFGSSLTSAHYADHGSRVIRLGNIGTNEFKGDDAAFIPDDYARELSQHQAQAGDVVMAGLGDENQPLGRAALVPDIGKAIVKADCFRLRPGRNISGAYLAWALSAPPTRARIALLARGSTRQRINTTIARAVEIPVPDPTVQDAVLDRSADDSSRIDTLIREARYNIMLSKERRAALITAAVTGQIDVSTGKVA
jgi:type I restriction enzyme S subunit